MYRWIWTDFNDQVALNKIIFRTGFSRVEEHDPAFSQIFELKKFEVRAGLLHKDLFPRDYRQFLRGSNEATVGFQPVGSVQEKIEKCKLAGLVTEEELNRYEEEFRAGRVLD